MEYREKLECFLFKATEAFTEGSLEKIDDLLSDNFRFEFFFYRDGDRMVARGRKSDYVNMFRGLFERGVVYSNWTYEILSSERKLFRKVAAEIFFRCDANEPGKPERREENLEKIVCEDVGSRLKLKKLVIYKGELEIK